MVFFVQRGSSLLKDKILLLIIFGPNMAILSRQNSAFKWLSLLTVVLELPFCAITMGWPAVQFVLRHEQYFVPNGCKQMINGTVSMIDSNHQGRRSKNF